MGLAEKPTQLLFWAIAGGHCTNCEPTVACELIVIPTQLISLIRTNVKCNHRVIQGTAIGIARN